MSAGRTRKQYVGERFGRLLITSDAPDIKTGKYVARYVNAKCEMRLRTGSCCSSLLIDERKHKVLRVPGG